MAKWGMDVEDVKSFAKLAKTKSDELETIATRLKGKLDGVDWTGPDAEKFRSEWDSNHAKNLKAISDALEQISKIAAKNALQQEQVSK